MVRPIDAQQRFEATRRAVTRLDEVHALIMYDCDDWKPESVRSGSQTSDPTAARAIYAVDELDEKLAALRAEERELTALIGESLAIIAAVREGFGTPYANLLEWRYIDGRTWSQLHDDYGIKRSTGHYLLGIAFDWIDSVGVSRLLRGEAEL